MIRKLRRRFIAVNMCILTSVLLGVLTGIYVYMYSSEVKISYELMESILNERDIGIIDPDKMHMPDMETDETEPRISDSKNEMFPENDGGRPDGGHVMGERPFPDPYKGSVKRAYIMLLYSGEGDLDRIIYQYFDDVDEEELKTAARKLTESGSDKGKTEIGNYKFRYMKKNNAKIMNGGFRLLLLDRTLEVSTINRLLFIFIIIGSVGSIVIFGISIRLANWMIKPVDKAWKQQKQFVADASHELKTPLTVISSNTDVILSSPEDTVASQEKWLNYIKEETKRMTKLVSNMLYIAKYDSNEIKFVANKFDLSDVMSSICLQYEALFFEQGKTLETEIEENVFVSGDEDKLKQLINILLDNAGKYSTEKGRIKAVLSKEPKAGRTVIEVSNTSGYIPAEKLEKLFDRFYRLDNSRNRKTGGSGLGLNIARSIADMHGGRIYAKHERNITTFIVEL